MYCELIVSIEIHRSLVLSPYYLFSLSPSALMLHLVPCKFCEFCFHPEKEILEYRSYWPKVVLISDLCTSRLILIRLSSYLSGHKGSTAYKNLIHVTFHSKNHLCPVTAQGLVSHNAVDNNDPRSLPLVIPHHIYHTNCITNSYSRSITSCPLLL